MFTKVEQTNFPPKEKLLMVFDGDCSFCIYWIIKWKNISADTIEYSPYQEVYTDFEDIPKEYFKEAVRLIEPNGKVYSGPDAAYYTYYLKGKYQFLHRWYEKYSWFNRFSDFWYQWIANRRSLMLKISVVLFGIQPNEPKRYWVVYLLILLATIALASYNLTNT